MSNLSVSSVLAEELSKVFDIQDGLVDSYFKAIQDINEESIMDEVFLIGVGATNSHLTNSVETTRIKARFAKHISRANQFISNKDEDFFV